jgi:hypothetical protein
LRLAQCQAPAGKQLHLPLLLLLLQVLLLLLLQAGCLPWLPGLVPLPLTPGC